MKFTSTAVVALSAALAAAAPTEFEKRTFGIFTAQCDTGSIPVQVNTAVTQSLFGALNVGNTLWGLATQCNNQILSQLSAFHMSPYGSSSGSSSSSAYNSGSSGSSGSSAYNAGSSGSSGSSDSTGSGSGSTSQYNSGSSGSSGSSSPSSSYSGSSSSGSSSGASGYTFTAQRQQFTQNLVAHMRQQYPNYSVVAALPGSYAFSGTPINRQTVQCATSAGNVNYDVLVYTKGTFNLHGNGGFQNWAYIPNTSCKCSSTQVAC